MKRKVRQIEDWLRTREVERTNERGNAIKTAFLPTDRYVVDFAPDFGSQGWFQYDTDQDAHYFGVWVNPTRQLVLTYAEGDWSIVECPDREHYLAEIQSMNDFYGEGYVAKTIDNDGTLTTYRQNRQEFLEEAKG